MPHKLLSKTRLMKGIQCPKSLWLHLNKPELEPATGVATQNQFNEGNEVGEAARKYLGRGTLIENEYWDLEGSIKSTKIAIKNGDKLIFEAAFSYNGFYARADILKKTRTGWQIIEVKKSTSVKDYHYQDAAIQFYIFKSCGIRIDSVSVMHLNKESRHPEMKTLFTVQDVTKEIKESQTVLVSILKKIKLTSRKKSEPQIKIGPHCHAPFQCSFSAYCWKSFPKNSVFDLPRLGTNKAWALVELGTPKITDLDANDFRGNTKRAIEVIKNKKPFINAMGINKEIQNWKWPLYFFDFETVGPAIPRYKGTTPYSQTPFQFSCHIWKSLKNKKLGHFEYLHQSETDPRKLLVESLLNGLGTKGSIVAYNKSFEIGVIKKLADSDRRNEKRLIALIDRFVDPLPILREHVYHPKFYGSYSIKSVAPALLGSKLNYNNLSISDGSTAQAYAEQLLRGKIKGPEAESVAQVLFDYCRQDTLAMVELVKWLIKVSL